MSELSLYDRYRKHLAKIADVSYSVSVLNWDLEVCMPEKGSSRRGQQMAALAGISHELFIDPEFGNLLQKLSEDKSLSWKEYRNVKLSLRDFDKKKKFPAEFVEEMSLATSEGFVKWQQAKQQNRFEIFAPALEHIIDLKRKECELTGYTMHPYDALLDSYEPGCKTKDLENIFWDVKTRLVPFIKQIFNRPQNQDAFMFQSFDKGAQWDFGIDLLRKIGYDFEAGRQDISSHPFTINFGSKDVRVTTRINTNDLNEMIWSTIHEGGHALYEQGIPDDEYGLPSGESISLGIHESQSRLWENNVGRSLAFWKANFPELQQLFPENLSQVSVMDFYKAMNIVKPSLIRTNADELTYHFHILIRFELEKMMLEKSVSVNDLPKLWNQKYKEYMDLDVPDDAQGILQDIHWSHGSMGYFPTYSIGSFYAAQFFAKAKKDIPELAHQIGDEEAKKLLQWLRDNIHVHGRTYNSEETCVRVTGEGLNFNHFMEYARAKYKDIYSF
jgi:carboxypeptidase Taq